MYNRNTLGLNDLKTSMKILRAYCLLLRVNVIFLFRIALLSFSKSQYIFRGFYNRSDL